MLIVGEFTDIQVAKTATFNGPEWNISAMNQVPTKFHSFMNVTAVSGATPSMTVKYQYSYDKVNWVDITSGAFSAATAISVKELNGISTVGGGPWMRYVATISGSFSFNIHLRLVE